jgi:DNA-binding transcriptional LysR family regulator
MALVVARTAEPFEIETRILKLRLVLEFCRLRLLRCSPKKDVSCKTRLLQRWKVRLFAFSAHLVNHFVANGPYITAHPRSVACCCLLKALPNRLPARPWLVMIVTLKNRTLSPVVERLIECAREVSKEFANEQAPSGRGKAVPVRNSRRR